MNEHDLQVLRQYIESLEEASNSLESAYINKNLEELEKTKKFIFEIQSKINSMLE